ncbi:MAG: oligosaccharide flippase family protein, partial [Chloroflexi bacterium]|nr:oligosaccharide flippase family protein [Chloroflexota bacterium]
MLIASAVRIGRKTFLKLGSDLLGRLAQLALIVAAARLMTPHEFGDYAFAAAVGFILGQLSDFGLQLSLLRTLSSAKSPSVAGRSLGETLAARAGLVISTSVLALVVAASMDRSPEVRAAIAAVMLAMILGSFSDTLYYVFRAYGVIEYEAAISLAGRVALLGMGAS